MSQFPMHKTPAGIDNGSAIPMDQTPTPAQKDTEMYHGMSFDEIQGSINDSLKKGLMRDPLGRRIIRRSDGHYYRYEAGKPVRLTEEQLQREGLGPCW